MKRMWVEAGIEGVEKPKTRVCGWVVPLPKYPGYMFVAVKLANGCYRVFETTSGCAVGGMYRRLSDAVDGLGRYAEGYSLEDVQTAVRKKIIERATLILGE